MSALLSSLYVSTARDRAAVAAPAPDAGSVFPPTASSAIADAVRLFENTRVSRRPPRSAMPPATATSAISNTPIGEDDPLYDYQWHLNSHGQNVFANERPTPGVDINIDDLHRIGITGKGVVIGVHEFEPIDAAHEDLAANMVVPGIPEQDDLRGMDSAHATMVAGVIAAEAGNGKGGRGVAPEAKILDLMRPEAQDLPRPRLVNQSVGLSRNRWQEYRKHKVFRDGQENAQLIVKSAGNRFVGDARAELAATGVYPGIAQGGGVGRRSAHSDGGKGARWNVVVVGAVNAQGKKASYSQTGSLLWVCGLGGEMGWDSTERPPSARYRHAPEFYAPAILSTDTTGCHLGVHARAPAGEAVDYNALEGRERARLDPQCNYTARFNGTSAATPTVTGVAALMLQVNPRLSWRDLKYLLAVTARKIDAGHAPIRWEGLTLEDGWVTNAANRAFSNWYGFGLVDAKRAVEAARTFPGLPPAIDAGWQVSGGQPVPIPYRDENAGYSTVRFDRDVRVEAVQIRLRTTHRHPHNLRIALISPSGTRSIILPPLTDTVTHQNKLFTVNRVATNAFLDENAKGEWKLQIIDVLNPESHSQTALVSWELRVLGHAAVASEIPSGRGKAAASLASCAAGHT